MDRYGLKAQDAFRRVQPSGPSPRKSMREIADAVMIAAGLAQPAAVPAEPAFSEETQTRKRETPLFSGVPALINGQAVLADEVRSTAGTLTRLNVQFPQGAPDAATIGNGVVLLLYVDDLATPRARVRLADLLRQGGNRPLNIRYTAGQRVRLVLADENGMWKQGGAPEIAVLLT